MIDRHEALDTLVQRIRDDSIGGAADMAKETADAMARAVRDGDPADGEALERGCLAAIDRIIEVTPSVMPVTFVLHRIGAALEGGGSADVLRERVLDAAAEARASIESAVARTAANGAGLLVDGERLFTFSISSTVFAIVRRAREQGKAVSVVTTEARPANEGLQTITAMTELDVPVTIGIDAGAGTLVRGCTSVIVGGDTVTGTGDALCKIGSFPTALAARYFGVPFRVAVDLSKFDASSLAGMPLRIRELPSSDVVAGELPPEVRVSNPVFERVPHELIDSLITDVGVLHPAATGGLMEGLPSSELVTRRMLALHQAGG